MHVAMNGVDPVVVHFLQMSLHAISLRKNVLNNLCMKKKKKKKNLFSKLAYKISNKQEAQLMLTTGSTRLAVSRGQQSWYHFGSIATFR